MSVEEVERRLILLSMLGQLDNARMDGQACVWCGSTADPMEPIYGTATSTTSQLFACVYHSEENDYPERSGR